MATSPESDILDPDTAEVAPLAAAVEASDAESRTAAHDPVRAWLRRLAAGAFDAPPPDVR